MFEKKKLILGLAILLCGIGLIVAASWRQPAPKNSDFSSLLSFDEAAPTDTTVATGTRHLLIPKIGVDIPIIVGEKDEKKALRQGAWLLPGTADPENHDGYNNIVIAAHRYLYTSGPKTFFSLNKMEKGDAVTIEWDGQQYDYEVSEKFIVPPSQVGILDKTPEPVLTLFTCDPPFTTENRLVVTARLLKK